MTQIGYRVAIVRPRSDGGKYRSVVTDWGIDHLLYKSDPVDTPEAARAKAMEFVGRHADGVVNQTLTEDEPMAANATADRHPEATMGLPPGLRRLVWAELNRLWSERKRAEEKKKAETRNHLNNLKAGVVEVCERAGVSELADMIDTVWNAGLEKDFNIGTRSVGVQFAVPGTTGLLLLDMKNLGEGLPWSIGAFTKPGDPWQVNLPDGRWKRFASPVAALAALFDESVADWEPPY